MTNFLNVKMQYKRKKAINLIAIFAILLLTTFINIIIN